MSWAKMCVVSCVTVVLEKCPPLRASKTTSVKTKDCVMRGLQN